MTTLEAILSVVSAGLLVLVIIQSHAIFRLAQDWRNSTKTWSGICQDWKRHYDALLASYTRLLHRRTDDGSEADWWKEQE